MVRPGTGHHSGRGALRRGTGQGRPHLDRIPAQPRRLTLARPVTRYPVPGPTATVASGTVGGGLPGNRQIWSLCSLARVRTHCEAGAGSVEGFCDSWNSLAVTLKKITSHPDGVHQGVQRNGLPGERGRVVDDGLDRELFDSLDRLHETKHVAVDRRYAVRVYAGCVDGAGHLDHRLGRQTPAPHRDRKSTRLNYSHAKK